MSTPIPPWEPLSEEVLADQPGTYDRMRAARPAAVPRAMNRHHHLASASVSRFLRDGRG